MSSQTIADTLTTISDDKSLVLFNIIVLEIAKSEALMAKLNLTSRQFYSRISTLAKAGLIIRKNGMYFPTSLGKIVYEAQMLIGKGIQSYWKLKAIDSIDSPPGSPQLSDEEYTRLVSTLIESNEIKNILLNHKNDVPAVQKEQVYKEEIMMPSLAKVGPRFRTSPSNS